MHPVIVIPSRLASTRLPCKALADINGFPMIEHVIRRALEADVAPVVLASGDPEIIEAVRQIKEVTCVLTDPALPSGSDRVWAALEQCDPHHHHDVVINLQGDLPFIDPAHLVTVLKPLKKEGVSIGTLVAPITQPDEAFDSSVVKVACAFSETSSIARALYFSRQAVPWGAGPLWHHIGLYAWRRKALARFVTLQPSLLEQREKLEQLRALEDGMVIGCCFIEKAPIGVDVEKDLDMVREHNSCL